MSFGTGSKKYCVIASYSAKEPYKIYIDRVEKNEACTLNAPISKIEKGTIKLLKLALYTMKQLYPHVTHYNLQDHSKIYCSSNNKEKSISLAHDYIIKNNKTYYEENFNAILPGGEELIDGSGKIMKDSIMYTYNKSLKILDEPCKEFYLIVDAFPIIEKYKDEYNKSISPRDFINRLKNKYKDKYCEEIGSWLNSYMNILHISIYPEQWFILSKNIKGLFRKKSPNNTKKATYRFSNEACDSISEGPMLSLDDL
jgi:hypothetical protein